MRDKLLPPLLEVPRDALPSPPTRKLGQVFEDVTIPSTVIHRLEYLVNAKPQPTLGLLFGHREEVGKQVETLIGDFVVLTESELEMRYGRLLPTPKRVGDVCDRIQTRRPRLQLLGWGETRPKDWSFYLAPREYTMYGTFAENCIAVLLGQLAFDGQLLNVFRGGKRLTQTRK